MSSVDDLHSRYALNIQSVESYRKNLNLDQDSSIAKLASDSAGVLDFSRKKEAFDVLTGRYQSRLWSYFQKPKGFDQSKIFFFNSLDTSEQDEAEIMHIKNVSCKNVDLQEQESREVEKKIVLACCKKKKELREIHEFIIGRIYNFVKG